MCKKQLPVGLALVLCMVLAVSCATVPGGASSEMAASAPSSNVGTAPDSSAPSSQVPSGPANTSSGSMCCPTLQEGNHPDLHQPASYHLRCTPELMQHTICRFAYIDANGALHFAPSFLRVSPRARALEGAHGAVQVTVAHPGVIIVWEDGRVEIADANGTLSYYEKGVSVDPDSGEHPIEYGPAEKTAAARDVLLRAWNGKQAYAVGSLDTAQKEGAYSLNGIPWMLTTDGDYYIGTQLVATNVRYAGGRAVLFADGQVGVLTPQQSPALAHDPIGFSYQLTRITDDGWTDIVQVSEHRGYVFGLTSGGQVRSYRTTLAWAKEDAPLPGYANWRVTAFIPNSPFAVFNQLPSYDLSAQIMPLFPLGTDSFSPTDRNINQVVLAQAPSIHFEVLDDGTCNAEILIRENQADALIDRDWLKSIRNVQTNKTPLWLVHYMAEFQPELPVSYSEALELPYPLPLNVKLRAVPDSLHWVPRADPSSVTDAELDAFMQPLRALSPRDQTFYRTWFRQNTLVHADAELALEFSLDNAYCAIDSEDIESIELTLYHADGSIHATGTYRNHFSATVMLPKDALHEKLTYRLKLTRDDEHAVYVGSLHYGYRDDVSMYLHHYCEAKMPLAVEVPPTDLFATFGDFIYAFGSADYWAYATDGFFRNFVFEKDTNRALFRDSAARAQIQDDTIILELSTGEKRTFTFDPKKTMQTVTINGYAFDFIADDREITISHPDWATITIAKESYAGNPRTAALEEHWTYTMDDQTITLRSRFRAEPIVLQLQCGGNWFKYNDELYVFNYTEF